MDGLAVLIGPGQFVAVGLVRRPDRVVDRKFLPGVDHGPVDELGRVGDVVGPGAAGTAEIRVVAAQHVLDLGQILGFSLRLDLVHCQGDLGVAPVPAFLDELLHQIHRGVHVHRGPHGAVDHLKAGGGAGEPGVDRLHIEGVLTGGQKSPGLLGIRREIQVEGLAVLLQVLFILIAGQEVAGLAHQQGVLHHQGVLPGDPQIRARGHDRLAPGGQREIGGSQLLGPLPHRRLGLDPGHAAHVHTTDRHMVRHPVVVLLQQVLRKKGAGGHRDGRGGKEGDASGEE